jgi:FPC/CPF motif-containing protein YcgG
MGVVGEVEVPKSVLHMKDKSNFVDFFEPGESLKTDTACCTLGEPRICLCATCGYAKEMQEGIILHFELRGSTGLTTANQQTQIQHSQLMPSNT